MKTVNPSEALKPILLLKMLYPLTTKYLEGVAFDENEDREYESIAKNNFPLLPKNLASLDKSPPKVPAHFEIPGSSAPEMSFEKICFPSTLNPVSSSGSGAFLKLT